MVIFGAKPNPCGTPGAERAGRNHGLPRLNRNCAHSVNYHPTADRCPRA
jgi:hypothetical protein